LTRRAAQKVQRLSQARSCWSGLEEEEMETFPNRGTGSGTLIIIGGHEEKQRESDILKTVAERVGKGRLVVATVASSEKNGELAKEYDEVFRELGVKDIAILDVRDRSEALSEEAEAVLDGATTVFFTGGDQLRITSQLGDSRAYRRIEEIYQKGGTIAGTSAGASVMSETMLVEGDGEASYKIGSALRMAPGLGFLRRVIVDQHFAERGRLPRLLGAVAQNPAYLGVGIDENSAILVHGEDWFEVLGEGAVYVLDASQVTFSNLSEADQDETLSIFDVRMHVLAAGECFDLRERRPEIKSPEEEKEKKRPKKKKADK
jgi:cyanophycinase